MKNDEDISKLRNDYQQIRASVIKGKAFTIKKQQILQNKKLLINQTNIAQKNQHYQNLEELIAYRQKYDSMLSLIKQAKDKNYANAKYQSEAQKIFNDQPSVIKSQIKKIQPSKQQPQSSPSWDQNSQALNAFSQMPKNASSNIPVKSNSNFKNTNSKIINDPVNNSNSNINKISAVNSNQNKQRNSQQNNSNVLKSQGLQKSSINKGQLMSFFKKQQSKIQRNNQSTGFKDVLEKPPLASRSFKKKSQIKQSQNKFALQQQLEQLKQQKNQLQKMVNMKNQQQSKVQHQRYVVYQEKTEALKRINQLEDQIDYLNKDNQRLRYAQKSLKNNQNPNPVNLYSNQYEDAQNNVYAPYFVIPLNNDLRKISTKNMQEKYSRDNYRNKESHLNYGEEQIKMIGDDKSLSKIRNQFNQKEYNNDARSISNQSINRGDRFDSFVVANSQYGSSFSSRKRGLGINDPLTCTRNKVAFFKNSLVIVKDDQNQIAFKKSEMNSSMNQLRLIIYINNKTLYEQGVNIMYIDDANSYNIDIRQKLKYIEPNGQGRQVLNISIRNTKQLNSIIDAQIKIGQKIYDLWIPANFIKFDYKHDSQTGVMESVIITPDKQFANYQAASSILPLFNKEYRMYETSAFLNGKSKVHNGTFKLVWLQDRKLRIQGSQKWIDYLGFILCKFK